jgi:GNAT superfamily N-acetyltransferase
MGPVVELISFDAKYLKQLSNLIHGTIKSCYPVCYSPEVIDFFLNYHCSKELLRKTQLGNFVLAFIGKRLIGCGYLIKEEIGGIFVHPDYQKRGYGKQILDYLLQQAKTKKLIQVWLDATPIAKDMYLKAGFEVVEKKTDILDNNVPLEYFYMRKVLIPPARGK